MEQPKCKDKRRMVKKAVSLLLITAMMSMVLSCTPSYKVKIIDQAETDNVTPISLDEATEVQERGGETIVTFVVTSNGISVDSVVYIGDFYRGAEADAVYLVKNESAVPITPIIYFAKDTRIADYSAVEGQGYWDAPSNVEDWITVTPTPLAIPPQSAQGYVVALVVPKDAGDLPSKWAFQVGVAVGDKVQLAVSPWWLVSMR